MTDTHNAAPPAGGGQQQPGANGQGQPAGQQPQNDGPPLWWTATDAGDTGDGPEQQQDDGEASEGEGEGEGGGANDAAAEYAIGDDVAKFEIKIDGGGVVRVDANDARLPDARSAARELGLSQKDFGNALKLDTKLTAVAVAKAGKEIDAAIAKLGPSFPEERKAVIAWAKTNLAPAEASELDLWLSYGDVATRFQLVQRLSGLKPRATNGNANAPPAKANAANMAERWYGKAK